MKMNHSNFSLSPLLGAAFLSLLVALSASGQFVVTDNQTYDGPDALNLHTLDPSRTVIIESGGSITANTRVNMDGKITAPTETSRLILNGGSFTQANDPEGFKFPDSSGPVEIWINSGTMNVLIMEHAGYQENRPALILVGGGEFILQVGYGFGSDSLDPLQWVNFTDTVVGGVTYVNGLKAMPGYALNFEELGGGAVKISGVPNTDCASITLPASAQAFVGQPGSLRVSLTPGLNASQPVTVDLVSQNPAVAVPQGAVNGALTLTFPAGADYRTNILFEAVAPGSTVFYLTNATAAVCVTTTECEITAGVSLYVAQDSYIEGLDESLDSNFGDEDRLRVGQSGTTHGGRKVYMLFDATGLPEILSVDEFKVQRQAGTIIRTIALYAILGEDVNDWTELGITWNNAPGNNVSPADRFFAAYPGETLIFINTFQLDNQPDTVYQVPFGSFANSEAILNALNTGDRKLTLGLHYNSSQANTVAFRSKENGDGTFGPRLNVTIAAPVVPPAILGGQLNEAGDQVQLTGSAGSYATETFQVLSTSDLAEPLSNWTPVATSQFEAGSFSVTVPVDPEAPQAFYILEVQP